VLEVLMVQACRTEILFFARTLRMLDNMFFPSFCSICLFSDAMVMQLRLRQSELKAEKDRQLSQVLLRFWTFGLTMVASLKLFKTASTVVLAAAVIYGMYALYRDKAPLILSLC
jgi:hypothetical protein